MRYLGFSLFGEHYSMVRSTRGTIREPSCAGRGDEFDPAIGSLKQISAYLIDKRGFPWFDL